MYLIVKARQSTSTFYSHIETKHQQSPPAPPYVYNTRFQAITLTFACAQKILLVHHHVHFTCAPHTQKLGVWNETQFAESNTLKQFPGTHLKFQHCLISTPVGDVAGDL